MYKLSIKILVIAVLLIQTESFAQVFSGTTTAQFLKIEVGAKAIGMGGAFVARANDASCLYWNPGGIARLKQNSAMFSHTYWLADINHDYATVIIKMNEQHSLGISYTGVTTDDMKVRTEIYPEGTGELFTVSDYSLAISYGLNVTNDFSIGFTGKYIGQSIWHMTASTFAFDMGLIYTTPIEGLSLGMSVTNVGGKMQFEGKDNFVYYSFDENKHGNSKEIYADIKMDNWELPILFRVGLSMEVLKSEYHNLSVNVDALHPNDYNESVNAGFEYGFKERIFLRAGYKSLFKKNSEEGITAGMGLVYYLTEMTPLKLDYAFADFGILKSVHRISVELGF